MAEMVTTMLEDFHISVEERMDCDDASLQRQSPETRQRTSSHTPEKRRWRNDVFADMPSADFNGPCPDEFPSLVEQQHSTMNQSTKEDSHSQLEQLSSAARSAYARWYAETTAEQSHNELFRQYCAIEPDPTRRREFFQLNPRRQLRRFRQSFQLLSLRERRRIYRLADFIKKCKGRHAYEGWGGFAGAPRRHHRVGREPLLAFQLQTLDHFLDLNAFSEALSLLMHAEGFERQPIWQ